MARHLAGIATNRRVAMKSLSALVTILFLLMIGSVQAYDVNDPRYNPYAVPYKPYQPYRPSYQPQPSYQYSNPAQSYSYGAPTYRGATPRTQQQLMYESEVLRQRGQANYCSQIGGNARAQDRCYRNIR